LIAGSQSTDWHTIQDIAQETFIAGYRKLGTLREPKAFGSWILTICRNQAAGELRRRRPALPLPADLQAPATNNG
jgi:RNA polymerase sigma-70 factor, ECF subfamily